MNNLEKRFKIVSLAIIGNSNFENAIGDDKLETTANAIDNNLPVAEKMVEFLENAVLLLADKLIIANQN